MSRLRLRIDGDPGAVSLPLFVEILRHAFHALRDLDRTVSGGGQPTLRWFVDRLQTDSLVTDVNAQGDLADQVTTRFVTGVQLLEREATVPDYFTPDQLENLQWIAQRVGGEQEVRGFRAIHLDNGEVAHVTPSTADHVKEALETRWETVGSVMGTLEMISIHGRPRANIYDLVNNRAIRCNIPEKDRDRLVAEVVANLGKRVLMSGRLFRNATGEVVRMTLRSVSPLPDDADLPTVDDVLGSAPDYTDGLTTEEYMRRLRDA